MTLPGSLRPPIPQIEPLGPVGADEHVEATLVLRRRAPLPDGLRLTRAELEDRYGADPAELAATADALRNRGIEILEADPASRRLRIAGPAGVLTESFGTSLQHVRRADGAEHRYREGELSVPSELADSVVAVLGLDNRAQARSQARIAAPGAVTTSYTPPQLATIYAMPQGTDGTGQTIAIIELGGGFAQSDLDHYFGGLGIPTPTVTAVGVDGASNEPGQDPTGADGEVLLDIDVAGGIAPKSSLVVYFAPNTDAGFVDAISQVESDTIYSAFNTSLQGQRPVANVLYVSSPQHLGVRLGIRLPQSVLGKMLMTSDGTQVFAISESGFISLPLSTLYDNPILQPETTQVFLAVMTATVASQEPASR